MINDASDLDLANVEVERSLRAAAVTATEDRHRIPLPYQPLEVTSWHRLATTSEVHDVGEVDRVSTADEITGDEACGSQNHDQPLEVGLVDKGQDALLQ